MEIDDSDVVFVRYVLVDFLHKQEFERPNGYKSVELIEKALLLHTKLTDEIELKRLL